jgi:hypothetical protein
MNNILSEISNGQLVRRLQGMDSYGVKNAFFSNYLAGVIMLRLHDLKGLMLLNDPSHARLTSFSHGMSDVNFWGRAIFYPLDPLVKNALLHGHAEILDIDAGRILDSRVEKLMKIFNTKPDHINWQETVAGLILLRHRYELNSSLFDRTVNSLYKWNSLNEGSKRRAVGDAFLYLMQADPKSNLLSRMRDLAGSTMINDIGAVAMKFVNFSRLREDDAGGAVAVSVGGGTSAANIASTTNAIIDSGPTPAQRDLANTMSFDKVSDNQVGSKSEAEKQNKRIKKRIKRFEIRTFRAPKYF